MRGQDHPVHPDDPDLEHIAGHTATRNGPAGQALDKNGRDMLDRHIRFHVAANIEKTGRKQMEQQQQLSQFIGAMSGPPAALGPGMMPPPGGPQ